MPIQYSDISTFWTNHPCSGGNKGFPFGYWRGKKVLEIGTGTGVDADRFIRAGALYHGIDLTQEHLPYIVRMNAESIDYPDNYFDLVYSFGVIHHTLHPDKVVDEISRVVKHDGYIFIMLYNKLSWRYLIEIQFLRRILWIFHYHKYNSIRKLIPHPTNDEWVSMNTDDIGCPMARVYSKKETLDLLSNFTITKTWTENWGWFRMICAKK